MAMQTQKTKPEAKQQPAPVPTAANTNEQPAAKKGRAKKGEGAYTIVFVDADNKEHARVPANVNSIKIVDKAGRSQSFGVDFSPVINKQLAADGYKRRLDAFLRAGTKDDPSKALALAGTLHTSVKEGKLFLRGEGKVGRTFDFDLYIDAMVRTAKAKGKTVSDKQKAALHADLESKSPKERTDRIKKWSNDPIYKKSLLQIKAERAETSAKDTADYDATADF